MGLIVSIVNGSNHAKCVSLSNQKYMTQPILINYIIMNIFKNFITICLQLNCIDVLEVVVLLMTYLIKSVFSNETRNLNLSVFNMITGINESKTSTKHISCKFKCKFDVRKCNSDQWWNNNKC